VSFSYSKIYPAAAALIGFSVAFNLVSLTPVAS
jgi:hypothetical protein